MKLKNGLSAEVIRVEELQLSSIINTQFRNYNIKTVKDLLDFTGGDFTFFRGVGKVGQRDIERKIYHLGVDIKVSLSSTIWSLELPSLTKRTFVWNHIIEVEDLRKLGFQDISQLFMLEGNNYVMNIIKKLQNIEIGIGGDTEETILDTDLPARIKNAFYRRKYYFLSQVRHITDKEFLSIRNLGKGSLVEFRQWIAGRESENNV